MKEYRRLERQHPIFSPIALISTFLLALGLGIGVYFTGGAAFSPGSLSAVRHNDVVMKGASSHADLHNDCQQCHKPFAGIDAARCENCHENIAQDRASGENLHGRMADVANCGNCHLEHRGQDYDLKTAAVVDFDHTLTRFTLAKHTVGYDTRPLECAACHQEAGSFTVPLAACANCHQDADKTFMDKHRQAYGENCLNCHDGHDTMADFTMEEHAQKFALTGVHATTTCEDCHANGQFEGTPQECVACHAEPETHTGMFGTACADCHTPTGWKPAIMNGQAFDHEFDTAFSLSKHVNNYDQRPFTCRSCHTDQQPVSFDQAQCATCHLQGDPVFMTNHTNQFGFNCQSCHDGTGNMTNFDHNLIWPLEGQHLALECTRCHVDQVFKGTARECVACHEEPAIHAGLFGTQCEACHTADAWLPARLRQHTFPLDHGEQGQLDCAVCHVASYDQYTCTNCHEHDANEMIREHDEVNLGQIDLFSCAECHPTGTKEEHGDGEDD